MLQDRKSGLSESSAPHWHVADDASLARSDPVQDARRGLEALQQADGHWVFELGADATIPSDYVLCAQADRRRPGGTAHATGPRGDPGSRRRGEPVASLPTQTAWAMLALMAAGEAGSDAVRRGIAYLEAAPRDGAKWHEELYNAVGFPRVFYLRYHGYSAYFPLWALARYRDLMAKNDRRVAWGL
jgi:hypothetical protein